MKLNLLRHLRYFLLLFALVGLVGCWPEFTGGNNDNDDDGPDNEEPIDLPDPPDFGVKFFGTAADAPQDDVDAITTYFNQITPENAGKWASVEATRDVMNWDDLDAAYEFAQDYGVPFKFHTLVWGQQQPAWIDGLSQAEQLAEIEEWFSEVAARYPGIDLIDVVNEPINAPPSYKDALGGDGITGWDWLITAFELAREHFPNAELILNEYRILQAPEFTADYMVLIDLLQTRGLIDAIGEEGHFLEQTDPGIIQDNLDTLATTGLPIYITEFDVNFADDARHANVLRDLFTVFWEHAGVAGVTHWGYRQNTTWRPEAYLLLTDDTERPGMEWLVCYLNGGGSCTVPTYTPPGWQGDASGLTLEAELYDEGSGLIALGGVVAYTTPGDWLAFHGVEFQNTWNKLRVTYAKGDDDDIPAADITIHFGSPSSAVVATIELPSTGGWGVFDTIDIDWTPLATTQDVYIRFNNDPDAVANVDSVRFFLDDDNLVTNSGFETDTSGWSTFGNATATLSVTTAQEFAGNQSMIVQNRTGTGGFAAYNLTSAVQAGVTYTVTAQVFQAGAGADTVRLAAKVGCASGDSYNWLDNDTAVPANTWTQLSGSLDIPGACTITDVQIYFEGTVETTSVYIDEVTVTPPPSGGSNLVDNDDFETDTSGWSTFGNATATLAVTTDEAYAGNQSMIVQNRTGTGGFAAYNLTSVVQAGVIYGVTAQVFQAGAGADTVRLVGKVGCASGDSYNWLDNDTAVPANTWTQLSGSLDIPAACVIVDIAIFFEGTIETTDVYIDEVSVLAP